MTSTVRSRAAQAIASVLAGRSLDDALPPHDAGLSPGDRGLLRALAYGVLREHALLAAIARQMLARPLTGAPQIAALIESGLYQLRSMRVSPHAAVSESVAACDALGMSGHRGLVNAVLRRYQRERDVMDAAIPDDPATRHSVPSWLAHAVQRDWDERAETVLAQGNQQGPMTLRVNRRRGTREAYLDRLRGEGLPARVVDGVPDAVVLETAVGVDRLPGFDRGDVSVQDASAQLAADLLDLRDGLHVLDACAAPGGKAAHALERAQVTLLALDRDPARLSRVNQTMTRLGLVADVQALDATLLSDRWAGAPFDRILLDAPCSGTGVIRRHPDIKWLRRADDIPRMAAEQLHLMQALWPLLAAGGRFVYATCSILAAESEEVVKAFLLKQPEARHEPIEATWGEARRFGRRIAPGGDFDGFYYAVLRKPPPRNTAS